MPAQINACDPVCTALYMRKIGYILDVERYDVIIKQHVMLTVVQRTSCEPRFNSLVCWESKSIGTRYTPRHRLAKQNVEANVPIDIE